MFLPSDVAESNIMRMSWNVRTTKYSATGCTDYCVLRSPYNYYSFTDIYQTFHIPFLNENQYSNLKHDTFNPLKPELKSLCYLLALLSHHFLHVSRIRVKSLTFRRLMSYIYIWSTHS
jgi:hypothetical protein